MAKTSKDDSLKEVARMIKAKLISVLEELWVHQKTKDVARLINEGVSPWKAEELADDMRSNFFTLLKQQPDALYQKILQEKVDAHNKQGNDSRENGLSTPK